MSGKEEGDPKVLLLAISCLVHSQPFFPAYPNVASFSNLPHPNPRRELQSRLHVHYFFGSAEPAPFL